MDTEDQTDTVLEPAPGLRLELERSKTMHGQFFVVGGQDDEDSGGWLLEKLEHNLRHCLVEKAEKIAPVRNAHPEWWLALVDRIAYGHGRGELRALRAALGPAAQVWDRIILVSPVDPTTWFEL